MGYDLDKVPPFIRDRMKKDAPLDFGDFHPYADIPVRKDITVSPADNPPGELRLGWIIKEEIGITVINDYETGKVSVGVDFADGGDTIWDMT